MEYPAGKHFTLQLLKEPGSQEFQNYLAAFPTGKGDHHHDTAGGGGAEGGGVDVNMGFQLQLDEGPV